MLPACLLGMILVANATLKSLDISLRLTDLKKSDMKECLRRTLAARRRVQ